MKKHFVAICLLGFVGCVASQSDQGTPSSRTTETPSAPSSAAANAAQAQFPGVVSDWTSGRFVPSPTALDPHAQMAYFAKQKPRPETGQAVPQWTVSTGAPVVATPVTWSAWTTDTDSDTLAMAVAGSAGGDGVTTTAQMMGYAGVAANAQIFVFQHLYGANTSSSSNLPALVGYAAPGTGFDSGGLLFSYPSTATAAQLYALGSNGTLYCYQVPATKASVEAGGTASAMSSCAGYSPYTGGAVSHSSPWGVFGTSGQYAKVYWGDDSGNLNCVNALSGAVCSGFPFSTGSLALGEPLVLSGWPVSADASIYIGDAGGNYHWITDNGAGTVTNLSVALCPGGSCTSASSTYGITASAGGDFGVLKQYIAAGATVWEFPLEPTSATWVKGNYAGLTTTGVLSTNVQSSVTLDQSAWMYIGWSNELQKIKFPFTSGGSQTQYASPVVNPTSAQQNLPQGTPYEYGGSIYIGTSGRIEQYDCTAPGDTEAPLIQAETSAAVGSLVTTLPITDWANGNVYVGFCSGASCTTPNGNGQTGQTGTGGITQHSTINSTWVCPNSEVTVSGVCSSGAGTTCASSCSTSDCSATHLPANTTAASCSGPGGNGGTCSVTCAAGFGNCDGNPYNGCEANLHTDPNNCSACGDVCSTANTTAAPTCSAGVCEYTCAAGSSTCGAAAPDTAGCTAGQSCGSCCGSACGGASGSNLVCMGSGCIATDSVYPNVASDICQTVPEGQTATITCPSGALIKRIVFASFGTPTGTCGNFAFGTCDSSTAAGTNPTTNAVQEQWLVQDQCIGQNTCNVVATQSAVQALNGPAGSGRTSEVFGVNSSCASTPVASMNLYIEAQCACDPSAGTCNDNSSADDGKTGVDCGGANCSPCVAAQPCSTATDCLSGVCAAVPGPGKTCQDPSCTDGVKDGTETGVDCGGSCDTRGANSCGVSGTAACTCGAGIGCVDPSTSGLGANADCSVHEVCNPTTSTCGLVLGGGTCSSNAQCETGLVCSGTTCLEPYGGACTQAGQLVAAGNAQCQSGLVCDNGTGGSNTCREGYGDSCSATQLCVTGLVCDSVTAKCLLGYSTTVTCASSTTCASTNNCCATGLECNPVATANPPNIPANRCIEGGGSACSGTSLCSASNNCCAEDEACVSGTCHGKYGATCPAGSGATECDSVAIGGGELTCDGTINECLVGFSGNCAATGAITGYTITNGGVGYVNTSLPTVTLTGGGGSGATPTIVAAQITGGHITGITKGSGGSGWLAAPTVTITGGGAGVTTVATATATVGGCAGTDCCATGLTCSGGLCAALYGASCPAGSGTADCGPGLTCDTATNTCLDGSGTTCATVAGLCLGIDCCATGFTCSTIVGGICRGNYGSPCPAGSGTTDCVTGLTCDSATNTCLEGEGSSCAVTPGCNGTDCCASGLSCTGGVCHGGYGAACPHGSGTTDCGTGLSCDTATNTCLDAYGTTCGTAAPSSPACVTGLGCDPTGNVCHEAGGSACSGTAVCETGYSCSGTCVAGAGTYGDPCPAGTGAAHCGGGLFCDTATNTCLDNYLTSCGTAAPTTPLCATGFKCDSATETCLEGYGGSCATNNCATGLFCDTTGNLCHEANGSACNTAAGNCASADDCCTTGLTCSGNPGTCGSGVYGSPCTPGSTGECGANLMCSPSTSTCLLIGGQTCKTSAASCAGSNDCCASTTTSLEMCNTTSNKCGTYGTNCPAGTGSEYCEVTPVSLTCDTTTNTCLDGVGTACAAGSVASVAVVTAGSNYGSSPAVTFSGANGSGANFTANINTTTGVLSSFTQVSGGTNYVAVPSVSLSGGGGTTATTTFAAPFVMLGGVTSITVAGTGSNYSSGPTVTFGAVAHGVGAAASAVVSLSGANGGEVTGFNVSAPGAGYTVAPTISGFGAVADTQALIVFGTSFTTSGVSPNIMVNCAVGGGVGCQEAPGTPGTGYYTIPAVTFTRAGLAMTAAQCPTMPTAVAVLNGTGGVGDIKITNQGACTVAPTGVTIAGIAPTPPSPPGTPVLGNFQVGCSPATAAPCNIAITASGNGYTAADVGRAVTFDGTATTAATAQIHTVTAGQVTAIRLLTGGTNYTVMPTTVTIPPPPVTVQGSGQATVTCVTGKDCCASGLTCSGAVCTTIAGGTYGAPCGSCNAGLTCDTTTHTCLASIGTSCASESCANGVACGNSVCGGYGAVCPAGSGTTDCNSGLTCDSVTNTCEVASGGVCAVSPGCSGTTDCCANDLACSGTICQAATYGAACPAGSGTSSCAVGLFCDTATNTCLEDEGQTCAAAPSCTSTNDCCTTGLLCSGGACALPSNGDVCNATLGCASIDDRCLGGLCVFVASQQNLGTFSPPSGCTSAIVKMWGGGGGGGGDSQAPTVLPYAGGGGGYITGLLNFGTGTVTMSAGGGGTSGVCDAALEGETPAAAVSGGGGPAGACSTPVVNTVPEPVGSGGGESVLYLNGVEIMAAGGGGGGAGGAGGAGGGYTASAGNPGQPHAGSPGGAGGAGTTTTGGAAGTNVDNQFNAYATAGSSNQGGNGGGAIGLQRNVGGGGGGGWFGGGGGARGASDGTATGGAGGGGSSFYSSSAVVSVTSSSATGATPANTSDATYGGGTWGAGGVGSSTLAATPGQGGLVTLTCQY